MLAASLSTSQRHLQVFLRVSVAGALCLRFVSCPLYVVAKKREGSVRQMLNRHF